MAADSSPLPSGVKTVMLVDQPALLDAIVISTRSLGCACTTGLLQLVWVHGRHHTHTPSVGGWRVGVGEQGAAVAPGEGCGNMLGTPRLGGGARTPRGQAWGD